jgi:ribosomal protein L4
MNLLDAKVLFVLDAPNEKFAKSARNLPVVNVRHAGNASVYEILEADEVIMTEAAAKALEQRLSG